MSNEESQLKKNTAISFGDGVKAAKVRMLFTKDDTVDSVTMEDFTAKGCYDTSSTSTTGGVGTTATTTAAATTTPTVGMC